MVHVGHGHGGSSCCDEFVDAGDAATPDRFELDEHGSHRAHRCHVAAGQLFAAAAPLGQQAGPFQYGDVFLHGGEAHVVLRRECGDRVLPGEDAAQDVAPGPVGERVEQGVRPVLVFLGHDCQCTTIWL